MDNYDSSIKSMYLTIFILGLVELLLPFVGIATFITALILRSKLADTGRPNSRGINLMLIGSGMHIGIVMISLASIFSPLFYLITFIRFFSFVINILLYITSFVIIIIGSIMIYKEYDVIN